MTAADAIGAFVADCRAARVNNPAGVSRAAFETGLACWAEGPVIIDITPVYESAIANPKPVRLYEDHPCITPPWPLGAFCYVNRHGNVVAVTLATIPFTAKARTRLLNAEFANPVDTDRVRWLAHALVWAGGKDGTGRPVKAMGPLFSWVLSVYDDGEPADIGWIGLTSVAPDHGWEMTETVLLRTLNFLNASNVGLTEPARPRPERRRLQKAGVTVKTLTVYPPGNRSRSASSAPAQPGVPLTSVRGHFRACGPRYGRGLLFGKYEGRFWIPQHAVGDREHGEIDKTYRAEPEPQRRKRPKTAGVRVVPGGNRRNPPEPRGAE